MMILHGYKEIAAYLTQKTGPKSERTCQRYARDEKSPLPVRESPGGGPVFADTVELDRWIARRWRARSVAA